MEDLNLFKQIPLFVNFKLTELMSISMVARLEKYFAGEGVFQEGDPGDALFIIKNGRVRVAKRNTHGYQHTLAFLEKGEYFGEISLVDQAPRSASVTADMDTELLKITRTDFKNLIAGNRELERKFYKSFSQVLCERLRVTNDNLTFSQEINSMIKEIDRDR
jgi:CRP-like cAMP-binding protein